MCVSCANANVQNARTQVCACATDGGTSKTSPFTINSKLLPTSESLGAESEREASCEAVSLFSLF